MSSVVAYFDGSDLSSTDGNANRVLTLANTTLTTSTGFLVFLDGLALTLTDQYTTSHNASSSTVTFLLPVWNTQKIVVSYFASTSTSTTNYGIVNQVDREINKYGSTITLVDVTSRTFSDWGDETKTTSNTTLTAVPNDISGMEEWNKEGRYVPGDKLFFCKSDETNLEVGNRIIFGTKTYEIKEVIEHNIQDATQCFEIRASKISQ